MSAPGLPCSGRRASFATARASAAFVHSPQEATLPKRPLDPAVGRQPCSKRVPGRVGSVEAQRWSAEALGKAPRGPLASCWRAVVDHAPPSARDV